MKRTMVDAENGLDVNSDMFDFGDSRGKHYTVSSKKGNNLFRAPSRVDHEARNKRLNDIRNTGKQFTQQTLKFLNLKLDELVDRLATMSASPNYRIVATSKRFVIIAKGIMTEKDLFRFLSRIPEASVYDYRDQLYGKGAIIIHDDRSSKMFVVKNKPCDKCDSLPLEVSRHLGFHKLYYYES